MCLIIGPGKDGKTALLPREAFDYTYSRNKDGFGAMWVADGRVQHFKAVGLTADEIYTKMEELVELHPSVIFHMRLKTHGKVIPGLAHPFRILNKSRHGKDLFFMHNGILGGFGNDLTYGQSDTTRFKDKILVPLLTRDPDALDDPEVWASVNKLTSGSRLVFMDSDGNVKYTSKNSWNDRYGLTCSNDYMLPMKKREVYTPPANSQQQIPLMASGEMQVTHLHCYFRNIDRGGVIEGHWVSCPKIGFIRTEAGNLYKDNGVNEKIYHAVNFIPKSEEFKHLGLVVVPPVDTGSAVMEDDDVPFDFGSPSADRSEAPTSGRPAPVEQRLRYARLMHNLYGSKVTSRIHLLGDLVGMGDKELFSFVDEDPENATTTIAELIEMVIEYNDALWGVDPNHPAILDADEIIRLGQADYHRDSIQEITKIRRAAYEEQVKKQIGTINEILDTPDDQEVNVG